MSNGANSKRVNEKSLGLICKSNRHQLATSKEIKEVKRHSRLTRWSSNHNNNYYQTSSKGLQGQLTRLVLCHNLNNNNSNSFKNKII